MSDCECTVVIHESPAEPEYIMNIPDNGRQLNRDFSLKEDAIIVIIIFVVVAVLVFA